MIAIGCDHGGIALKKELIKHLEEQNISYKDFGTYTEASCDYPDIAKPVCESILSGECEKGILICGTGIGISMAANKIHGIRAALCHDYFSAKYTRKHNDSNIIAFGARVIGPGLAAELLDVFLNTEFEGGRHAVRVQKMMQLEQEQK
jgi:ribose 5-phosphate isomerase B